VIDYVADIELLPVSDGARTFWSWRSRFRTPPGRERERAALVAAGVYEAGFGAVRERLRAVHPFSRGGSPESAPAPH